MTYTALAVGACWLAIPSTAAADGLPGEGVDTTRAGVSSPDGNVRFVAIPAGRGTLVERISQANGIVLDSTFLTGNYVVPGVAYDGSTGGISADARTLALIRPRTAFPRSRTQFAILDAERMRLERTVRLDGDFSYDAISPNGNRLYLIAYTSPRNLTEYQVRAFDLRSGKLLPDPIVDPEEEPGDMFGTPMSREMSPDGRWAYTLYIGEKYPFIHALDTRDGAAVCIDLDTVAEDIRPDRIGMSVAPDGTIEVLARRGLIATVAAGTFEVSPVKASVASASASDGGGMPWMPIGVGALAVGLLVAGMRWRRRRDRLAGPLPPHVPYSEHALRGDWTGPGGNGDRGDADRERVTGEAAVEDGVAIPVTREREPTGS